MYATVATCDISQTYLEYLDETIALTPRVEPFQWQSELDLFPIYVSRVSPISFLYMSRMALFTIYQ